MAELILYGAAALLVPVGLAVYAIGVTRAKNSAGAVMRSACALCVSILIFWVIGFAIWGQSRNGFFWVEPDAMCADAGARGLFLAVVVAIAACASAGAIGERSTFLPVVGMSAVLAGLVVPVAGNWAWNGWLHHWGFVDAAGATFVHVSAGVVAGVGALFVGARQGKYHRDGSTSVIPGHSLPLAGVGVLLLVAGWIPYVCGCVLGSAGPVQAEQAAFNVVLCASAGGLAALLYGQFRYEKPDVLLTFVGFMGALVASTAGAATLSTPWTVLTGAVAGVLVPYAALRIDVKGRIDDPTSAVAIHAIGGAWGALAAGLFASGTIAQRAKHLGIQILGVLAIALFAAACAAALFAIMKAIIPLRAKEADEYDGLDLAQHDVGAYPDFQQNTIRSYHLRET